MTRVSRRKALAKESGVEGGVSIGASQRKREAVEERRQPKKERWRWCPRAARIEEA